MREESKTGKNTFRDYEGEKIRYPEFIFKTPEAEKFIGVVRDDIEGKWKGMMMARRAEHKDEMVAPYNSDIDYVKEYQKINFNIFDAELTPQKYKELGWFDNNRITAYEELFQYIFNCDIVKVNDGSYSLRLKSLFKKITMECFFSKHERNHETLDYYLGMNYDEERRKLITGYMEGSEVTIYDSDDSGNYLEKEGEFYTLDHNSPEPDEIIGDVDANCKLTYNESRYRFVLQQIRNNQLVLHGAWFADCIMNRNDLIKEINLNGTRQFRTILQRD